MSAVFVGDVKPFCPCDTGRPEDCKPEDWPGAHAHRHCTVCGAPDWRHRHGHADDMPVLYCWPTVLSGEHVACPDHETTP